ncbi:MAG: cytochrome c [Nitrospirota bacterium]
MKNLTIFLSIMFVVFFFRGTMPAHADEMVLKPRVPADKMALAKGMTNPNSLDKGFIAAGKEIFSGKGRCVMCHGETGKGDSPMAAAFNPKPRDFTNLQWQKVRTDGEIFWAISEGTDYGMIPFGSSLSEKERWELVNYIREIGRLANPTLAKEQ